MTFTIVVENAAMPETRKLASVVFAADQSIADTSGRLPAPDHTVRKPGAAAPVTVTLAKTASPKKTRLSRLMKMVLPARSRPELSRLPDGLTMLVRVAAARVSRIRTGAPSGAYT